MSWDGFSLSGSGSAARSSGVAAVSRIPGSMELWFVGTDGSVQGAYWYDTANKWQRYQVAPPGSAATTGGIAAVSRIPGSMELWFTGTDGSIQGAYWYDNTGNGWQRYVVAPPGSAATTGSISAVSRIPGSMELWFTGADASIQGAYWYDNTGNGWQRYELASPGSAATTGSISAVSRIPGSMELWFIGADGSIQDHYWYDTDGKWQTFELAPPGSAATMGSISAVSRIPGSMELWFIGADGSIQDHYWYDSLTVKTFDKGLTTSIAVGGSTHLVLKNNGSFTFSGHAHDSGFDNIDYTISAAVMTPDGIVFTFQHSGHTEGTVAGLPFGTPNRDDNFQIGGSNPQIVAEWSGLVNGTFDATMDGTDTLARGVEGAVGDLVKGILAEAGKAAAAAVIALVV